MLWTGTVFHSPAPVTKCSSNDVSSHSLCHHREEEEEEEGARRGKGSWLRRSAEAFGKMGKGFALTGAVAGTAFLAAACCRRQ